MAKMRSLNRSICFKSLCSSSAAVNHRQHLQQGLCYFHLSPPPPPFPFSSKTIPSDAPPDSQASDKNFHNQILP
ncbi:hypothetical protein CsSME_00051689 [Camellia sinensis var. sinensis]